MRASCPLANRRNKEVHLINIYGIVDEETKQEIMQLMSGKSVIKSYPLPELSEENRKTLRVESINNSTWDYVEANHLIMELVHNKVITFDIGLALYNYIEFNRL